ncbi:hypothetical protein MASR1M31_17060 [Porphyromonadaceae bacterium]
METTPTKRTAYDWVIETISFLSLIGTCVPLFFYNKLGEGVPFPIHYNLHGKVDGWGDLKFFSRFVLAAIVLYLYLTFSERFFKRFLYPVKITEQNASIIYRIGIRLRRHLKLFVMLLFAYNSNTFLYMALSGASEQPYDFISAWLIGLLAGSILFCFLLMEKLK